MIRIQSPIDSESQWRTVKLLYIIINAIGRISFLPMKEIDFRKDFVVGVRKEDVFQGYVGANRLTYEFFKNLSSLRIAIFNCRPLQEAEIINQNDEEIIQPRVQIGDKVYDLKEGESISFSVILTPKRRQPHGFMFKIYKSGEDKLRTIRKFVLKI